MKDRPYITCRELIEFISSYLDGELGAGPRAEFERHLAACPSCVAYLDGYRQTVRLGKVALAATDEAAAKFVPVSLVEAIRKARLG